MPPLQHCWWLLGRLLVWHFRGPSIREYSEVKKEADAIINRSKHLCHAGDTRHM